MLRIRYRLGTCMYKCCREILKNVDFKPGTTTAGKGKERREIDEVRYVSCNNA